MPSWPSFKFPPVNLFNLPPWRYEMSDKQLEDLQMFFQTDEDRRKEEIKDFLTQIQTGTVIWELETQILAMNLVEEGYLEQVISPYGLSSVDFNLSEKGKKVVGL